MSHAAPHEGHGALAKRLKRAHGHLHNVIAMLEGGRPCADVAQQLQAVERAISAAKKAMIHEHLDECLSRAVRKDGTQEALAEFKDITKYL